MALSCKTGWTPCACKVRKLLTCSQHFSMSPFKALTPSPPPHSAPHLQHTRPRLQKGQLMCAHPHGQIHLTTQFQMIWNLPIMLQFLNHLTIKQRRRVVSCRRKQLANLFLDSHAQLKTINMKLVPVLSTSSSQQVKDMIQFEVDNALHA